MEKKIWIYDLETLNIFTATFIDRDSDETRVFILSNKRNDIKELFEFLNTKVKGLIGYNCIHFDAQILEFLYRNPRATALQIKKYAEIITDNTVQRKPDVPEWNLRIPHLDLFRALSLSVKSKRTGLKWCEYMLDLDNIEDMPSQGHGSNWEEQVLAYNLNDVIATKKLYETHKKDIELRVALTQREGINLINSSEPDIAKKIFSKYLSKAMGIPESDLKTMSTERTTVNVKDIILPYISFKSDMLNMVLNEFLKLELYESDKPEFTINFGGSEIKYALGGIHGSMSNVIIESDDKYIIKSCDVASFYPNLAIRNRLHPAHIPQDTFCNLYESLYNERRSIPKKDPRNYVLKIALNATYGLSNDKYSFLRDRQYTVTICINGQLLLSMLFEKIILEIPDSKLLMCNTDGFEVLIPREYQNKYNQICKEWEELTKLELEFVDYSKMIISDVNNYIAVYQDITKEPKCKGRYEFKDIPLYKNKSHNIIAIAIFEYFVNNKPIEETIRNHTNIFDFCAGVKASWSKERGKSHYELHSIKEGSLFKEKLSKTVRYYISTKGKYLFKCYENGTIEHVEAPDKRSMIIKDWKVTYFNKAFYPENFSDYNIDYSYYISKARKWINELINKSQYKLEF